MKRIILESAPEFVALCLLAGLVYALVQYYRTKHQPWTPAMNWLLLGLRALLVTLLAFLLLGPIIKQTRNNFERPHFVILHDNSRSVRETVDSTRRNQVQNTMGDIAQMLEEQGFSPLTHDLSGQTEKIDYREERSDINAALRTVSNRYEGQNIGGVVLISDGIYNSGLSPLYATYNYPIYTVGVGDTTQRIDAAVKNVAYNKIVYEGNRYPVRVEVQVKNISSGNITVSLVAKGKTLDKQVRAVKSENELIVIDFQPLADEKGIQKLDVVVERVPNEQNVRNNRSSAFIEVVEGKKKILVVAPSPHPDIKALREVIQKNANYEFLLHIPGIIEQPAAALKADNVDLVIFHQSPDNRGRTTNLYQSFAGSKTSMLLIYGQQTEVNFLSRGNAPLRYESAPRELDEVTPVINPNFTSFTLTAETAAILEGYPPSFVHFGKSISPPSATPLLFQKVGSVPTDKPLVTVEVTDARKTAVVLGEGIWRWRLHEYERMENTNAFDEVFGKLIQFLSTTEDRKKFRSYPLKQEFPDIEPVVFESQVYNDIFEPVYGNTIALELTDESGKRSEYTYVTSPGNIRYQIGGLKEGVYRYRSSTQLNGKTEEVRGQFAVVQLQAELQNLTADFDLLRRLSASTGGKFYKEDELSKLQQELAQQKAQQIIHTEESYDSLINLKWVFFVLVTLVASEWFLRKFHGSY